ncbi:Wadjet anti-phage system protein JetA family protein [Caproicibacter fermentans]|uniref:TIGR02677 family protein n=1 Tax=Caproicibacter fermentans TaxID=2576756 RepID=A0A7G8T888_9FIRM|nr:Wadjet anti-phage system protein JetA family protein [Caproicibacter fermentans]QNK39829.1 hypothetical protein HCR03_14030 [Caproicibacter fermentans]
MGLLPKDLSPRFFNLLISIHKEYYIHVLLLMESTLSEAKQIALPRSAMMRELHRRLERENWREDLSDEEDFGASPNEVNDTAAYTVRKFIESGWIDSDESGDRASDMVFITLYGKKLTDFVRNLLQLEDQSGHVVNTYSNLQQVRLMPENGYVCVKNAYDSTRRLLTSLEMMYSKIKSYYTLVLENQRPEALLQSHLNGYVHDVVDKVLFPLKVDDSVDRFKGPILSASADLLSDTPLLNTVLRYAVQARKEATEEDARAGLLEMLHFIHSQFDNIEAVIRQLDDRNNLYLRVTRQKLQYMLTMDTSLKGNIISLLKRSKAESEDFWESLAQCCNFSEVGTITDDSFYRPRRNHRHERGEDVPTEPAPEVPEEDVTAILDTVGAKFVKSKINAFAGKLLQNRESISSQEFRIENDEDYLMSIYLATNSDDYECPYRFTVRDGVSEHGRYLLPEFTLKEKKG